MTTPSEPLLVIHTRLPQRLVRRLDVYAAERGIFRQDALAEILERELGKENRVPVAVGGAPAMVVSDLTTKEFHAKYGHTFKDVAELSEKMGNA